MSTSWVPDTSINLQKEAQSASAPTLTKDTQTDWAIWSLSLILRDIAIRLTVNLTNTTEVPA